MSAVKVCSLCGYAVEVEPVAVLMNGRLVLELRACGHCRASILDAVTAPRGLVR